MNTIALELEGRPRAQAPTEAENEPMTLVEERKAHAEALVEALGRYPELETLDEKRAATERKAKAAADEHGVVVVEHRKLSHEISRQHSRSELALRRTAPRLIHDSGPAISFALELKMHVRRHMQETTIHRDREYVRDWERAGRPKKERRYYDEARARVRSADAAEEFMPTVDGVLEAIRDLQLEPDPDLPNVLAEILSELPDRCPSCGATIDTSAILDWTPDSDS